MSDASRLFLFILPFTVLAKFKSTCQRVCLEDRLCRALDPKTENAQALASPAVLSNWRWSFPLEREKFKC